VVLEQVLSRPAAPPAQVLTQLDLSGSSLDTALIIRATQHPDPDVRAFGIKALATKGELPPDWAIRFTKDSSVDVRRVAYRELIQHGVKVDPYEISDAAVRLTIFDHDLGLALYGLYSEAELHELADWYNPDGPVAYEILASRQPEKMLAQLRADLSDSFVRFRQESSTRLKAKLGPFADDVLQKWNTLDDFTSTNFIAAALRVIRSHVKPEDAATARKYIGHPNRDVQLEAIHLLESVGDKTDVNTLLGIAQASYGILQELAASTSLKLAPGPDGAAIDLIKTDKPNLIGYALDSLSGTEANVARTILEPLVKSSQETIRVLAVAFAVRRLPTSEIEPLLTDYLTPSSYYYNVVCWLDRILYAPEPLRSAYKSELDSKLSKNSLRSPDYGQLFSSNIFTTPSLLASA
jgi:hypothetical protein